MKLFYSWQSDTPARVGKNFLHDALKDALEQLKLTASVEEAERFARAPQVEDERAAGSPGELRELLKAIGECATFVADVTPLGQSLKAIDKPESGMVRKFVDSDVAFEIGYASHLLGDRKVLLLFNAHYGWHDDLPMNLRNRGGAIAFTLVPNASRPEIESERKKLVSKLLSALGQSMNAPPSAVGSASALPSGASVANRACYFRAGEILAHSGKAGPGEINYSYASDTLCYLRLIPLPPLERPLPLANLRKVVERAPLLSRQPEGALSGRNEYGAVAYEPSSPPSRGPGNLSASTQLFITGEIWSIGNSLIAHERGERPQWIKLPFLSSVIFERVYYDQLRALSAFALEHLTLSAPWEVECGVAGSKGLHLWVSAQETSGPIVQSDVIIRRTMKSGSDAEMDSILLEFFNLLHAAAGSERASELHGFPPGRPR
jgi:hypothetical protein